jgi:hypothetical protein
MSEQTVRRRKRLRHQTASRVFALVGQASACQRPLRAPLDFCGYAILHIVVSTHETLRAVVGVLYFFVKRV